VTVPIPLGPVRGAGDLPFTAMLHPVVSKYPPAWVVIDNVSFLEWRAAETASDRWVEVDVLRGTPGHSATVATR